MTTRHGRRGGHGAFELCIAAGVLGRRVASRTKGQVGCSAIKARRELRGHTNTAPPFAVLPIARGEQFICPLLVRLFRLACPMPCRRSLPLHSPSRFPQIDFIAPPQRSTNSHSSTPLMFPALLWLEQAPATFLTVEIQVPVHGSENHTHLPEPHPFANTNPPHPYCFVLPFLHIPPSSTTGRPSHHYFPQASPVAYNLNIH
jgi:hypothetical protein